MFEDVTILMPAFNEERGIEEAVESAAPQCGRLIVSDNASTDRTSEICGRLAKRHPNLEYVRQDVNAGNARNSKILFSMLKSPLFMFMGAHDRLGAEYVKTLREALLGSPGIGLAAGVARPFSRDGSPFKMPDVRSEPLRAESAFSRVEFIAKDGLPKYGAFLISGLMRAETYKECFDESFPLLGGDILVLAGVARRGRIAVSDKAIYHCEVRLDDSQRKYYQRLQPGSHESDMVKRERSAYARRMYAIARESAGWSPLLLPRLFKIRMHLSVNYGKFEGEGAVLGALCDAALKFSGGRLRWNYFAPGSETVMEDTLSGLMSGGMLEGRRLALYGAGLHTRRLLATGIIPLESFVAIFDDAPSCVSISGVKVWHVSEALEHPFDILLISSDTIADELWRKSEAWIPEGVQTLKLYPPSISAPHRP